MLLFDSIKGGLMNLKKLSDHDLLKNTELAAMKEREATTNRLHHLNEVYCRRLFAFKGCSSLFGESGSSKEVCEKRQEQSRSRNYAAG